MRTQGSLWHHIILSWKASIYQDMFITLTILNRQKVHQRQFIQLQTSQEKLARHQLNVRNFCCAARAHSRDERSEHCQKNRARKQFEWRSLVMQFRTICRGGCMMRLLIRKYTGTSGSTFFIDIFSLSVVISCNNMASGAPFQCYFTQIHGLDVIRFQSFEFCIFIFITITISRILSVDSNVCSCDNLGLYQRMCSQMQSSSVTSMPIVSIFGLCCHGNVAYRFECSTHIRPISV